MIHLKVLIIDNNPDLAEDLVGQMQPEICPEDCVFINSFHKALESLVQDSYNIIFIADHYPQDALNHFLKDIKNLKEKNHISLISILEPVKENTSAKKTVSDIFDLSINRVLCNAEKKNLRAFIHHQQELAQEREKLAEVEDVVEHILSQVDKAAIARKRGAKQHLTSVHRDYVASYARSNQKIMETYVENLTDQSEKRAPTELPEIEVSEKMLKRRPPKLSATGYSGVSSRVWKKLSTKLQSKDEVNEEVESELQGQNNCVESDNCLENQHEQDQSESDSSSEQAVITSASDDDET